MTASGSNDPGTLADTRVGDYLTIQERGTNDFGMYVVESVAVEVKEEQTIREFAAIYERRAKGSSQVNSSRCEITTSRPMYVVNQDTEPKVSTGACFGIERMTMFCRFLTTQPARLVLMARSGLRSTVVISGPSANPDDFVRKDWTGQHG